MYLKCLIVSRKSIRNKHFRYMYSHSSFCNVRFTYTINRINKFLFSSPPSSGLIKFVHQPVFEHSLQVHSLEGNVLGENDSLSPDNGGEEYEILYSFSCRNSESQLSLPPLLVVKSTYTFQMLQVQLQSERSRLVYM